MLRLGRVYAEYILRPGSLLCTPAVIHWRVECVCGRSTEVAVKCRYKHTATSRAL